MICVSIVGVNSQVHDVNMVKGPGEGHGKLSIMICYLFKNTSFQNWITIRNSEIFMYMMYGQSVTMYYNGIFKWKGQF